MVRRRRWGGARPLSEEFSAAHLETLRALAKAEGEPLEIFLEDVLLDAAHKGLPPARYVESYFVAPAAAQRKPPPASNPEAAALLACRRAEALARRPPCGWTFVRMLAISAHGMGPETMTALARLYPAYRARVDLAALRSFARLLPHVFHMQRNVMNIARPKVHGAGCGCLAASGSCSCALECLPRPGGLGAAAEEPVDLPDPADEASPPVDPPWLTMAWGSRGCDSSAVVESLEWGLGPAGGDDFGVPGDGTDELVTGLDDCTELRTDDGYDD